MKIVIAVLIAASLGGCVPLVVGGVAGAMVAHHEANWHARCMHYYGNPDCRVGYGAHRGWIYAPWPRSDMPMGVHQ